MSTIFEVLPCRWHEQSFTSRVVAVSDIGINLFSGTNLTNPGEVTSFEQGRAKDFFRQTQPDEQIYPALANWFRPYGLVEHSDFAAAIAYSLADAVNQTTGSRLNPHEHEVALQLHDLGRTTTHSFMETDVMTDHLWRIMSLRQDLHDLTHSAHLYWDEKEIPPEKLTIAQKISIVADTAGKRSSVTPNRLRLVEEIIPSVQAGKSKYLGKQNPTPYERMMVDRLPQYTRRENEAISYTLSWFAGLGISLDAIIQTIPIERLS